MSSTKQKAQLLRKKGYSYNMISEQLGVAKSTQSYWFSGKPYKPNDEALKRIKDGSSKSRRFAHNLKTRSTRKTMSNAMEELGALSNRDLWLLGLGIYIGEGSKSIESVRIVNSDPAVIRIAVKWFREICNLKTENLILSVNLYPDNDEEDSKLFWSNVTGVPLSNFRKTQIDTRQNKARKRKGKLPYGTLQIRIKANGDKSKGVELFRRIRGWTEGAVNQV